MFAFILLAACFAFVQAAPVATTLVAPVGTIIGNGPGAGGGTLIGKAPFGTFTAIDNHGSLTLLAANPLDMTASGAINGATATFSGVIPQFTAQGAGIDPSGAHFVGNGPLGTLVLGEDRSPTGIKASFAAIGTRTALPNLSGYIASGALNVGPGGANGNLVATNAHSTIIAGFNGGTATAAIAGTLPKRTAA